MHPNSLKRIETLVLGPMGWIGCVRCEKSWCDFVARTFALIAPFQPVLHRVSWSYETIPNAPKHYETHQNMSLESNGVDQVRSLRKITTWLHGTNFCINWTSSVCFATSFMQLRNDPKCTQILRNAPKHSTGWIGSVCCEKSRRDFMVRTFALIALVHPVCTEFHAVTKWSQMRPNTMKHTKTWV